MPTEDEVKSAESLLSVNRYDSIDTIRKKQINLIKNCHPDKSGDCGKASLINSSFDILKEFKKTGIKLDPKMNNNFVHPIQNIKSENNTVEEIFKDLKDFLIKNIKIKEEDLKKSNLKNKKEEQEPNDVIKKRLTVLCSSLLTEMFTNSNANFNFKERVIITLNKEFEVLKNELNQDIKKSIIVYINNLFGLNIRNDELIKKESSTSTIPLKEEENITPKKRRKGAQNFECKIKISEGIAAEVDLKRLINKGTSNLNVSIKTKNYYINRFMTFYYIEKITKKDSIIVICRDESNNIYKLYSNKVEPLHKEDQLWN